MSGSGGDADDDGWREAIGRPVVVAAAWVMVPAVVSGLVLVDDARVRMGLAIFAAATFTLGFAELRWSLLSPRLRAYAVVGTFLVFAFTTYLSVGPVPAGGPLGGAIAVLGASILLGRRAAWWTVALVMVAFAAAALITLKGRTPIDPNLVDPTSLRVQLRVGVTSLAGWVLVGTLAVQAVRYAERGHDELRAAASRRSEAESLRARAVDARREAERLGRVGQLSARVAHDLNNLLLVIRAWNEVGRDLPASESGEAHDNVKVAAQRGAVLVRRLLMMGRRETRAPRPLDLVALAREADAAARPTLPADCTLQVGGGSDTPVYVLADEEQLSHALLNLVVNAAQSLAGAGHIEVTVTGVELVAPRSLTVGGASAGSWAVVAVSDTGRGMDASTRAQAFAPFFTTKANEGGTGLGLATVAAVAEQSGGGVELDSQLGEGTRVAMWLPRIAAPAPVAGANAASASGETLRGRTILLVEDNALVRRHVARVLAAAGCEVREAYDVTSALEQLASRERPIDLLCSDCIMPGRPLRDLLQHVEATLPAVPILLVSGYVEQEVTRRGVEEGRYRFLAKPFAPHVLLEVVGELLAARSPGAP